MQPLGIFKPEERELAGDKPVLTSVNRTGLRHVRELDESTAYWRSIDERQRRKFCRERASVRSWVDRSMGKMVEGVEGLLKPSEVEPPVFSEIIPSSPRLAVKKTESHKRGNVNTMPLLSLPTDVSGKSTTAERVNDRGKKKCQIVGVGEKASQQSPKTARDAACSMPQGFPLSFEESGFECLIHWADVSFQEVLLTALGPRSERQRRGNDEPNNRLLVSVACYLLNEVLTREQKLSSLWLRMRDVIFKAIFATPSAQQTQKNAVGQKLPEVSFATRQDYKNLHLWSDRFLASLKENTRLSDRVAQMQCVVRKKQLILRFAQRRVDKMRLEYAFVAWRKTTQQRRAFREAAMKYITRVRHRMYIEGCFLRWRRVAACSHVSELTRMLRESEIKVAFLETSCNKTVASITSKLEEEQKAVKILKLDQEALKSQLAESHVLALRAIDNELRQHQINVIAARKDGKRWERLAKTFAARNMCQLVPFSLKKSGFALRLIEEELAASESVSRDLCAKARSCLESFLLEWVNLVMKNSPGGIFWCRAVKINTGLNGGDFGASGLQWFVRVLESFYLKKGAKRGVHVPPSSNRESFSFVFDAEGKQSSSCASKATSTLFAELKNLLYVQTTEGLFPSLLSHCHFAETFFTPESFCQVPHPSAMLWVLASLFVGHTRLICGGPVIAKNDIDIITRCRNEKNVCNNVLGFVRKESTPGLGDYGKGKVERADVVGSSSKKHGLRTDGYSRIVANDTIIKKKTRSSALRKKLLFKPYESDRKMSEERASTCSDAERLADTLSDLEVYLGLDKINDEYSSSSSHESTFHSHDGDNSLKNEDSLSSFNPPTTDALGLAAERANSADVERWRRVQRKAGVLPPIEKSLCSLSMREFVNFNHQELNRRRTWLGLSRIVTSLVVRFGILDIESIVVPNRRISLASKLKKGRQLISNNSSSMSSRFNSPAKRPQRRYVQLNPSVNTGTEGLNVERGGSRSEMEPVTLRSILDKSR